MNRNWLWLVVAAVAAGSIFTTMLAQTGQTQSQVQWEYKVVAMSSKIGWTSGHPKTEAKLNELGKGGWELVGWEEYNCLLKRQVAD